MNTQFRRILDLIRKTGDRMIVTDPDASEVYVVMDLDSYEGLLGDGGVSRAPNNPAPDEPDPVFEPEPEAFDFEPELEEARNAAVNETLGARFANPAYHAPEPAFETEPEPAFEPEPVFEAEGGKRAFVPPPPEPKHTPEPVFEAEPEAEDDEDPDESQFYLEPIE